MDDKPIAFVHYPLRNTFADTSYAYEENIPVIQRKKATRAFLSVVKIPLAVKLYYYHL